MHFVQYHEIAGTREAWGLCCCSEALGWSRTSSGMAAATAGKQLALFYKVRKGSSSGAQRTATSIGQERQRFPTGPANTAVSTEQISSVSLALVQAKSAIYLDRICALNHSQVLCSARPQGGVKCFLQELIMHGVELDGPIRSFSQVNKDTKQLQWRPCPVCLVKVSLARLAVNPTWSESDGFMIQVLTCNFLPVTWPRLNHRCDYCSFIVVYLQLTV